MTAPAHNYDESKIKTLSSLEHIRKRPGMYIGRLGDGSNHDDGIYILLKEVVDNAIDEFIMGAGKRIDVSIDDEGKDSIGPADLLEVRDLALHIHALDSSRRTEDDQDLGVIKRSIDR